MVGRVAMQQALIMHFGLSYRESAMIARIHQRTLWQHVAARRGSKVRSWFNRSEHDQQLAIAKAAEKIWYEYHKNPQLFTELWIKANRHYHPIFSRPFLNL